MNYQIQKEPLAALEAVENKRQFAKLINCTTCNIEFLRKPKSIKLVNYCSKNCESIHKKTIKSVLNFNKKFQEYIGKKFNMLTIGSNYRRVSNGYSSYRYYVEVTCDCGKTCEMGFYAIKNGTTVSCGCVRLEKQRKQLNTMCKGKPSPRKLEPKVYRIRRMIRRYKESAKQRNYRYELNFDQFESLVCSSCHYCGKKHIKEIPKEFHDLQIFNGIDRKNNNIGYEIDNCVSCCTKCNFLKRDYSYEDFTDIIKKIATNLKLLG